MDCDLCAGDQDFDLLLAGEIGDLDILLGGDIGDLERCFSSGDLDRDLLDLELYSFLSTGDCAGDGDLLRPLEGLLEWEPLCLDSL